MNRILLPLLGLLLAPVLCWAAEPKAEEAKAIAEIEKLGGRVTRDEESPGRPVVAVDFCDWESSMKACDAAMRHLKGLTKLRKLNLSGTRVTDNGLLNLKGLNRLEVLGLGWTKITDTGLENLNLKGLNRLQRLILSQTQVTDNGLVNLKGMNHLQYLFLDHTHVADAGLVYLQGMNQLQELNLEGTKVTDAGLVHLKDLNQLQELNLSETPVADGGLENLALLSKLQTLSLRKTNVTGAGLRNLEGLKRLKSLDLGNHITDAGLAHLKGMIQLESLWLHDSPVTDVGVTYLEKLQHLQVLGFAGTEVSDEGVRRLRVALPYCTIAWHPRRKLVLDCFPDRVRPLFVGSMPSLEAEKTQGERIAKAIADPGEAAVAACRALGAMDASWNFIEEDQRLALHVGRTVSGEDFLKALHRLRGDRRGELGAARFCFDERYDVKIPEAERSEWTTYLARTALEYGNNCNRWSIVRRLGKLNDLYGDDYFSGLTTIRFPVEAIR